MIKALVPGSFDPITVGHLSVIERAAKMYGEVFVTVFINPDKTPRFNTDSRVKMIRAAVAHLSNVRVDTDTGMLADYCERNGITVAVKGARNAVDFEYEKKMAEFNKSRNPLLETVILFPEAGLEEVSSTALYELIKSNGEFEKYVPSGALEILKELIF